MSLRDETSLIPCESSAVVIDQVVADKCPPPLLGASKDRGLYVSVLSRQQRFVLRLLITSWLVGLLGFYAWWLRIEHVVDWFSYTVNTLLVTWTVAMPAYFFYFACRMKQVDPEILAPSGWRVAMITTRAPSEPFCVVKHTLEAMLAQRYPHDTWLADEAPNEEIIKWCRVNDVRICTREGIAEYHRDSWPRRTKCKEGNLAYFYDHHGYENYEFVVQLDADHVPQGDYLESMLRPFVDPSVGYVSAPSICNSNAQHSWSARGRLYSEAIMHGPLQAGYTNGFAPLCIGSHYAVRTKALRDIGGIGPELAEDHSTTLLMSAVGWKGAHAFTAIAYGEGPPTFAACATQEFQWSRSLMVILLTLMPKCWPKLPWHLRFQFLFSELWYPLFSLSMLVGTALPVIAIMTGRSWVRVSYLDFLSHTLPILGLTLLIIAYLRCHDLLRPNNCRIISWETALFQVVRWPWSAYGSLMGIISVARSSRVEFRVTPKGNAGPRSLSWKILAPYIAVVLLTFLPTWAASSGEADGYHYFLIISQFTYCAALFSLVLTHYYETSRVDN